jgi:hypothetical protein
MEGRAEAKLGPLATHYLDDFGFSSIPADSAAIDRIGWKDIDAAIQGAVAIAAGKRRHSIFATRFIVLAEEWLRVHG